MQQLQDNLVLVVLSSYNIKPLTYKVDCFVEEGQVVEVPYRNTVKLGVIIKKNIQTSLNKDKIKTILTILNIKISQNQLEFLHKSANYYLGPLSSFLKMTIPISKIENTNNQETPFDIKNTKLLELNPIQSKAYNNIKNLIKDNDYKTILLDGITGSGKTEVYFKLIEDQLSSNKENQILILLPEIILTTQLIKRFKNKFNYTPVVWHSAISTAKKNIYWHNITSGKTRVIIGTRSALYLPFNKLSLIILEEEHDHSFKQEEGILYNARDMAILKAYVDKIPIILVSATPSLETYLNIKNNKFATVPIKQRHLNQELPQVNVINLNNEKIKGESSISPYLINKIAENLKKNQQSLLFLNRRGYAPIILCNICNFRFTCKNCTTSLVYHKNQKTLKCHYCNNIQALPKKCPECKEQNSLISYGPGVEKLHEEITNTFPDATSIIITKDTVTNINKTKQIFEKIINNEVDIIIGTQIIAKGHHFPNLTLVGIIDADLGLFGSDLRAMEKTYQLLEQVSGRAGRENIRGTTIIQTYYPDNPILHSIINNDTEKFYQYEASLRQNAQMPPFTRLAAIIISGNNEEKAKKVAFDLVKNAPTIKNIKILGPSPSNIYRLKRKYRYRILVNAPKQYNIQHMLSKWLFKLNIPSSVHIKIDIDPYNFI